MNICRFFICFSVSPLGKVSCEIREKESSFVVSLGFEWFSRENYMSPLSHGAGLVPYSQALVQDGETAESPTSLHMQIFNSTIKTQPVSAFYINYQQWMFIWQNTFVTTLYSIFLDNTIQWLTCLFENDATELNSWAVLPAAFSKFLNNKTSSVVI